MRLFNKSKEKTKSFNDMINKLSQDIVNLYTSET